MYHIIPTPEDLWGDCSIPNWNEQNKTLWKLWLSGIAAVIIFANQSVIERVANVVKETTLKAKAGDMTAEESIEIISPNNLISKKEWDEINNSAKKQGEMINKFLQNNNKFSGNN
jgi:hypothetical protein